MKYNLPKGYLSSSACDLWERSKQDYMEKYFLGKPGFSTPYTKFGKWFAEDIEHHPEKYPNVPKGSIAEFPVKWVIEGVPVLGYLDSFEPSTKSIYEYKTSVNPSSNGWNKVKVRKWKQLPFYAMCVNEMFGTYDPTVHLVVLHTEWAEICTETKFGGSLVRECEKALQFQADSIDDPVIYTRDIEPWEVEAMKERLVTIASEISEEYTSYQQSEVAQIY